MRRALPLLALAGLVFADGGMSCSESDYTYDKIKTTVWKARVQTVRRNGVAVTSGTYKFSSFSYDKPHSLAALDSIRILSEKASTTWPWGRISLNGAGIYLNMVAVGP